ncbi:MAG: SIS domain-containing protein [Verrucomicrobiaceae bacterium]|nr:SIS domain-containing protein [Verrucomicrobiaceae bacterium]
MTEADEYLKIAADFQLGSLETESQHPLTVDLSRQAQEDLPQALESLRQVDLLALRRMEEKSAPLIDLARAIAATFAAGKRIYLCGCGATGRLALSIEIFCRQGTLPWPRPDSVRAFMAGGDLALIKAIETFEDHPEYGARQLAELGFEDGDLLISATEGGETPFVIGATEHAAAHSQNTPWFLYCNPDDLLAAAAERSRRVLADSRIRKLNLAVGPMAISGSTRMQSSTVLEAAIGFALMHAGTPESAPQEVSRLLQLVQAHDGQFIAPFIEKEAAIYQSGGHLMYRSDEYGITVVTDTTERAPTFSLAPFEKQDDPAAPLSWCHFYLPDQPDALSAWHALLGRAPRTLDWPEVRHLAGAAILGSYDLSRQTREKRQNRLSGPQMAEFSISGLPGAISWQIDGYRHLEPISAPAFHRHLMLKMWINIHSTLVMGRMGRYRDNLMTFVKPSNNKLIDRAVRYVRLLASHHTDTVPDYETVVRALFDQRAIMQVGDAIVLRTLAAVCPGI